MTASNNLLKRFAMLAQLQLIAALEVTVLHQPVQARLSHSVLIKPKLHQ